MDAILAVFRSRAQAYDCAEKYNRRGIAARVVSTPTEARAGCGLSVRFSASDLSLARGLLSAAGYSAFSGYYRIVVRGGHTFIVRA